MEYFPNQIDTNIFYRLASSREEFPRIVNPRTAEDELLRIQADAITNHTRIYRVMLARARSRGSNTLLTDEHRKDFDEYISYLPEFEKLICEDIPCRYILTNNYEAMCLKVDNGKVIIVSEVLRYFLYFMNLGTISFDEKIPQGVRNSAIMIAIRTLLLSESLDFDLDPRGIVPDSINDQIERLVSWQMKFIIGHEYAHHILDHDAEDTLYACSSMRFCDGDDPGEWTGYLRRHTQEFDADSYSISAVEENRVRDNLFVGGTSFLLALYVFETVAAVIDPSFLEINSHPSTVTRYRKLVALAPAETNSIMKEADSVTRMYDDIADSLIAHFRRHPQAFTQYGSIYLDEWRGPILRDRIDY
ncbi:hypothetical protein [Rhizobium sp. NRK18]|uniref:hypothetical protein n=1 Tax=Rhizobium sp. NRK18 TaxID=2964667 RepID=UPI0021C45066|nr:hypothetical protein [Rhizobium sp. NRK18]MCQ2002357.1 hypothetical protein [Rhizobium sp. NRK18]